MSDSPGSSSKTEAPQVLVLSGSGRYGDDWHDHAATSAELVRILATAGYSVTLRDDVDAALAALPEVRPDAVVVNAGDPWRFAAQGRGADASAAAGLRWAFSRGVGFVGMHTAAATLRDYPDWRRALGGEWVADVSGHPPFGDARMRVVGEHPVTSGLSEFVVRDERYQRLAVDDVETLIIEDDDYPIVWSQRFEASGVVYIALGHSVESYASAELSLLVRNAVEFVRLRSDR